MINARPLDTNREVEIQIVDELTLVDFSDVTTATLCYNNETIDITDLMNKNDSSFIIPLSLFSSSTGDLHCEIVLKDKNDINILTTNTFVIKIKSLKGGCNG